MSLMTWTYEARIAHGDKSAVQRLAISYSNDELLATLRSVAAKHGKCTTETYAAAERAGEVKPSNATICQRFGGWSNALHAAGLPSIAVGPYRTRISESVMLDAVRRCADDIGRIPSVAEYQGWSMGRDVPKAAIIRRRLGGWRAVIRALHS
jgi:hypothetical protein